MGGDDSPVEFIGRTFDGERLVIDKFADGATSSVPMFNLIVFRGELDDALVTNGATRGHSAAAAAFSVAATPAAVPFDDTTPNGPYPGLFIGRQRRARCFTSDGPRRIILDGATGNELTPGNRTRTGGVVRQKPDITAADGVSCAAPGFNPFYGTSAAAPHAAAIAALVKSAVPGLTPAQVRTALVSLGDRHRGARDRPRHRRRHRHGPGRPGSRGRNSQGVALGWRRRSRRRCRVTAMLSWRSTRSGT